MYIARMIRRMRDSRHHQRNDDATRSAKEDGEGDEASRISDAEPDEE